MCEVIPVQEVGPVGSVLRLLCNCLTELVHSGRQESCIYVALSCWMPGFCAWCFIPELLLYVPFHCCQSLLHVYAQFEFRRCTHILLSFL